MAGQDTVVQFSYDQSQQLSRIDWADGRALAVAYDAFGRFSQAQLAEGNYTWAYDGTTGNVDSISTPQAGTLGFGYVGDLLTSQTWTGEVAGAVSVVHDSQYRVATLDVTGGQSTTYVYDADGMLSSGGAMTIARDPLTGLAQSTGLGSTAETWSFNQFLEVVQHTATYAGAPIIELAYPGRDGLGRVVESTESVSGGTPTTFLYDYDALTDRLIEVKQDGVIIEAYTYDSNDNRLTGTRPAGSFTGTYDDQDRLLSDGTSTYIYNAAGDLETKTDATGQTTYDYDVLGNLLGVTLSDGTQIDYIIDGIGRRIGKKVNGALVQGFLYGDALNPVAELDGAGNVVSTFVYVTGSNAPDYFVRSGTTYRVIADERGSARVIVDISTGAVAAQMSYDSFGNLLTDTAPALYPLGFAGGVHDRDTGLVRFGARDYDPWTGRFTSKDPTGFGGGLANLYSYADNDPVNAIDVTGEARDSLTAACGRRPPLCMAIKGGATGAAASVAADVALKALPKRIACVVEVATLALGVKALVSLGASLIKGGFKRAYRWFTRRAAKKRAEAARDEAGRRLKRKHATYVGGHKNGKVAAGCSSNPVGCAEDDIARQLGPDANMTGAKGWRRNKATKELDWVDIPVCKNCQGKYDRSQFPPGTKGEPGGAWEE